jgi:succinate dehydrogenase / fumarate reductase cytochrome b subunit
MEKNTGPLSPHIQIYKWQFSSLISITHSLTGVLIVAGFFFIVLWILFFSLGPVYYNFYQ